MDLLSVFVKQSSHYEELSLQFPNIYMWISNDYYEPVKWIGILFTFLFALIGGGYLAWKRPVNLTNEYLVRLALLSAVIFPFILPGMHERYMYAGDLLAVVYSGDSYCLFLFLCTLYFAQRDIDSLSGSTDDYFLFVGNHWPDTRFCAIR